MKTVKRRFYIMILAIITIFLAIPIFMNNFNCYIDEGIHYIARSFASSQVGVFSKVVPEFANGFGYTWSLFTGNLSIIVLSFAYLIFKNIIFAYKLCTVLVLFLSGITMFCFVNKISENKNIGLLSAGIYMLLPYHLTEIYVRNAFAEQIALAIIPLVFLGAYYLINNEKKHYYFAIALSLLFFADTALAIISLIISLIYILINFNSLKVNGCMQKLILNLAFIFTITATLWLPYMEANINNEYKINEPTAEELKEFEEEAISIRKLFVTAKGENYVFEIGPLLIVVFALTPMAIVAIKKEYRKDYIFYLVLCILCFWLATKYFPWKIFSSIFIKLGAPWRFLSFANFFLTIICALNMGAIVKKLKFREVLILLSVAVIYVAFLNGYIQKTEKLTKIEELSIGNLSGKSEEISAGINKGEYLPLNAYNKRFYIATKEQKMYVLSGKAIVEEEKKEGSKYSAKVQTIDEKTEFELPYIYYPGYTIKSDGMNLEKHETENGFLGFFMDANDSGKIEVAYEGTKIEKFANFISIISTLVIIGYAFASSKSNIKA